MFRRKTSSATPRILSAHRRSPWGWALTGALVGLLLATLLNAPARWLTGLLQSALGERALLQDARGTLWNGSARLTLSGGAGSTDTASLPGRLGWRIRPGWSGLAVDLNADCCMQQPWHWQVQPRWGGVKLVLSDATSQWPAHSLSGLGTPWNTLQVEGQLTLSTRALVLQWASGRLLLAGQAQLDALQVSSRLSTLRPMGSYRIVLSGGNAPAFVLSTLDGALQLSGSGQWVGSRLRFDGVASAAPERLDALSNLLNIIGRRDGARAIIKIG